MSGRVETIHQEAKRLRGELLESQSDFRDLQGELLKSERWLTVLEKPGRSGMKKAEELRLVLVRPLDRFCLWAWKGDEDDPHTDGQVLAMGIVIGIVFTALLMILGRALS